MAKPVVGLTGGIASGKSTVAKLFVREGFPVVDADQLARDVVAKGSEGLRAVVAEFGEDYLQADGTLDRAKMGALVFADESARKKLNAIMHPRIAQAAMQRIASLQDHAAPYIVYEAALLVENNLHRSFRALMVVAASVNTQMQRIMDRDELGEDEARARIASQMPLQKKVEAADFVIHNDGSLEELEARFREVLSELRDHLERT